MAFRIALVFHDAQEVFRLVGIASNIQKGKCNRVMRLNMPGWVVRWME